MTTKVIRQQASLAVPQERWEGWQRVKSLLSFIDKVVGMFLPSHETLSQLSDGYRSNLSVKEKTTTDIGLIGLN